MTPHDKALLAWQPASPAEAQALIDAVHAAAHQHGHALSPAPDAPENCCGNDCIECVWLGYYTELGDWRDAVMSGWVG